MEAFKIRCPKCSSTNIRSNDVVSVTCDVDEWTIDEAGQLIPEFSSSGSEVWWDATEPVDPKRPYECGDCYVKLSDADLLAAPRDEEDEDEEEGDEL